jgi:hypothetical protein
MCSHNASKGYHFEGGFHANGWSWRTGLASKGKGYKKRAADRWVQLRDMNFGSNQMMNQVISHGDYSHSILAGGLVETSYKTRLMPFTSLRMRWLVSRSN